MTKSMTPDSELGGGPAAPAVELTPLMKQYWELKAQAGDALLLFRMGDFYELFGEDAVTASRLLEITLTSRDKNKAVPLPMAGVPFHSIQGYIQRLLKAGRKVAICEQFEEIKVGTKTIANRKIVRTLTPAIQFDSETSEAAYLATAWAADSGWVLACLDPATGETRIGEPMDAASLLMELGDLPIRHWLGFAAHPREWAQTFAGRNEILKEELPPNYLNEEQSHSVLKRQFNLMNLEAFFPEPSGARALGILIHYVLRSQQRESLSHLRFPEPLKQARSLLLGPRTAQHLDLFPDLFDFINRTRSALGARTLKRACQEPLRDTALIELRQEAIRELASRDAIRESLSTQLASLYDLERIAGRLTTGLAHPRDTLALGQSLAILPRIQDHLSLGKSQVLTELRSRIANAASRLSLLGERILLTQREDAPLLARDGGIFKLGTTPELDRLIGLTEEGGRFLVELEARERTRTGIPSLKVRYNRVFGYYIEVTQSHLKNVPADYQRKQTTVGAERFFTEELKKFEDEIVTASSRQKAVEQEIFEDLLREAQAQVTAIMEAARALGELDAWTSLARLSEMPGWCFPVIDDSRDLDIRAGRHPLVDRSSGGSFVPNDLQLSPSNRLALLITGPNMGGKSTIMRQAALIVILGQMGAPVPAAQARWGVFHSIYTRIGAHDAIARGQSTFMVEMSELAHILHHADDRSLIVLDEIGRGTSTYDGISVAWSTLEWLCNRTKARLLFATHYHELTSLAGKLPCLANTHMAVAGDQDPRGTKLRFLYQMREGATNDSFGIQVARLAGLPAPVIERSWAILDDLESGKKSGLATPAHPDQMGLFEFATLARTHAAALPEAPPPVLEPSPTPPWILELESTPIDSMTPLQALNFLAKLQETARGSIAASV